MKVLIINGSPHHSGSVASILKAIQEEILLCGHQAELLHIADLKVTPCTGCMKCRTSDKCVLPADDANRVLRQITEAEALVIGSPCYWGNMSGQLKLLFDRMVYGMIRDNPRGFPHPLHKGKRAIIVATGTTPWPFNILFNQTRGTIRAIKEILGYSGFGIVGTMQKGGTKKMPQPTGNELARCRRMARKLIRK